MTSREAIERLEELKELDALGAYYEPALDLAIAAMKDLEVCRNELCLRCGQYKQRHLGACDGCRWKE